MKTKSKDIGAFLPRIINIKAQKIKKIIFLFGKQRIYDVAIDYSWLQLTTVGRLCVRDCSDGSA